jgi:restriction endonuclease S subunit
MRKWRRTEKGKAYTKAATKAYFKTEKGKLAMAVINNKRRAYKKKCLEELSEREEGLIKQIYAYRVRLQNKLGIDFHVDHIVPISKGGLHHPSNLQVVPAVWNVRKNNRNTEIWLPNGM